MCWGISVFTAVLPVFFLALSLVSIVVYVMWSKNFVSHCCCFCFILLWDNSNWLLTHILLSSEPHGYLFCFAFNWFFVELCYSSRGVWECSIDRVSVWHPSIIFVEISCLCLEGLVTQGHFFRCVVVCGAPESPTAVCKCVWLLFINCVSLPPSASGPADSLGK